MSNNTKIDNTALKAMTPTVVAMLTGYVTVSDAFLAPLAVVMETMPASTAWITGGVEMAMYMA